MWCDGHVVGSVGRCARVLVCGVWPWHHHGGAAGGAAGGSSQSRVVRVVGNMPACVPGGGDAPLADLQIGIDDANNYVVLIRQIVQCARFVGERPAQRACHDRGSDLARHLGHGDALQTAMWGRHKQCTMYYRCASLLLRICSSKRVRIKVLNVYIHSFTGMNVYKKEGWE